MKHEVSDPLVRPATLVAAIVLGLGVMWGLDAATRRPRDEMVMAVELRQELRAEIGASVAPVPAVPARRPPVRLTAESLRAALATVRAMTERDAWEGLRTQALYGADDRVRAAALRGLAQRFKAQARGTLLLVASNDGNRGKLRGEAARLLGTTGEGAELHLRRFLDASLPPTVRAGAVRGLGASGSEEATTLLLALAEGRPGRVRTTAVAALAGVSRPAAAALLRDAAADASRSSATRAAASRALGHRPSSASAELLQRIVADESAPERVRVAAVRSLGRSRSPGSLDVVKKACASGSMQLARAATVARTRLEHWQ